MPSEAKAPIEQQADSVPDLDSYRTRDDFVRAYKPATDEELLLVTQIARAWGHLQEMYQLRSQVTAEKGLLALFNDDFDKYKILMRHLTEAERMWRHAVQELQRARRRGRVSVETSNTPRASASNRTQTTTSPPPPEAAHQPCVSSRPLTSRPGNPQQPSSGEKNVERKQDPLRNIAGS